MLNKPIVSMAVLASLLAIAIFAESKDLDRDIRAMYVAQKAVTPGIKAPKNKVMKEVVPKAQIKKIRPVVNVKRVENPRSAQGGQEREELDVVVEGRNIKTLKSAKVKNVKGIRVKKIRKRPPDIWILTLEGSRKALDSGKTVLQLMVGNEEIDVPVGKEIRKFRKGSNLKTINKGASPSSAVVKMKPQKIRTSVLRIVKKKRAAGAINKAAVSRSHRIRTSELKIAGSGVSAGRTGADMKPFRIRTPELVLAGKGDSKGAAMGESLSVTERIRTPQLTITGPGKSTAPVSTEGEKESLRISTPELRIK